MSHLLARLTLFRLARERSLAGRINAVLPIERTGVHVAMGERVGLRLDTLSQPGIVLIAEESPVRLKGGRGVWPELVAAADNALRHSTLDAFRFSLRGDSIEICTSHARLVLTATPQGSALLVLETLESAPRTLPPVAHASIPPQALFCDDVSPWIESLTRWLDRAPSLSRDEAALALESELPGLSRRQRLELLELAASDHARALCLRAAAGDLQPLIEHEVLADRQRRAHAVMERRRHAVAAELRREHDRVQRAQRALLREEASAPDAAQLRRQADALLSASRDVARLEHGLVTVPDPYVAGSWISIPVDPPGASVPQLAERLYARARKTERGRVVRAERCAALAQRGARLAVLSAAAEGAAGLDAVTALEAELMRLGIAAGEADLVSRRSQRTRRAGEEQGPARVFRSPSGFDVLVGRSARQNDQLTFKLAAPEDYWFHVKSYPGAHVVLRLAGRREAEPTDLRFAAQLAAAHSQAPKGEAVDVHVARRKHLGRPKGGNAGQVLVKKSGAVLRVVAAAPPPEPG